MKFEIKSRWNGNVLFSLDTESLKLAVEARVESDADLCDANLRDADLCDADLCDADLRDADLRGANLCGANLRGANLRGANLCGANLCGANLRDADLCGADLCGANLRGANLRDADLTIVRDDIWAVLSASPAEVPGLRRAILDGRINGSSYEGECVCLVGTIARERHCAYTAIPSLKPDSSRPAERFFLGINEGDTPETSPASKLALEWVDEWLSNMRRAFSTTEAT